MGQARQVQQRANPREAADEEQEKGKVQEGHCRVNLPTCIALVARRHHGLVLKPRCALPRWVQRKLISRPAIPWLVFFLSILADFACAHPDSYPQTFVFWNCYPAPNHSTGLWGLGQVLRPIYLCF